MKPLHLGISFNLTGGKVISQPLLGVSLDFMNDRRFPVSPHTDLAPPSPHHPAVVGFRVLPLKFCVHAGVLPSLPRRLPAGVLETVVFLPPLLCLTRVVVGLGSRLCGMCASCATPGGFGSNLQRSCASIPVLWVTELSQHRLYLNKSPDIEVAGPSRRCLCDYLSAVWVAVHFHLSSCSSEAFGPPSFEVICGRSCSRRLPLTFLRLPLGIVVVGFVLSVPLGLPPSLGYFVAVS